MTTPTQPTQTQTTASRHVRASARVAMGDTPASCARADGARVETRVLDISTGGALLQGPLPIALGERFEVHLGDLVMGACARRRAGEHLGVQFEELSPLAFAAIERRVHDAIRRLGDVELPDQKGGTRRVPAYVLQMQSVYETLAVSPSFSSEALRRVGEAALAIAARSATPLAVAELQQLRRVWEEPGFRLDHDARFGILKAPAPQQGEALPESIGRYRVLEHRATGGMAEIFVGVEPSASSLAGLQMAGAQAAAHTAPPSTTRYNGLARSRLVVVKRILPHFATSPAYLEMFVDEARWVSRIQHPNVVQIYEMGEHERRPFLALEYVPGFSLRHLLVEASRGKKFLPMEPCVVAVAQACAGLHAAHELTNDDGSPAGLVHRDVSPQNLVSTMDGEVKLLDFGLAKGTAALDDLFEAAGTSVIQGAARYLAPEQIRGEALDRRADVYALGVVAWELFAERRLFRRKSDFAIMESILKGDRPSLRSIRPEVPAAIDDVIARALHVDRDQRTPSAAAFRAELLDAAGAAGLRTDRFTLAELMESFFGDKHRETTTRLSERAAAVNLTARDEKAKFAETLRGVRGSLAEMSLAEIVQSIDQGNRNAEIQISVDGAPVGLIAMRARTIVSGAFGDLRGAPAVIAAMSLREGQFLIRHQEPRAALENMDAAADYLLLEAMRAIDEAETPPYVLDPLPNAWRLDAVLEDNIELVARVHEAARLAEMEAEMAAVHARGAQEELDRAAARISALEEELRVVRAQLAEAQAAAASPSASQTPPQTPAKVPSKAAAKQRKKAGKRKK